MVDEISCGKLALEGGFGALDKWFACISKERSFGDSMTAVVLQFSDNTHNICPSILAENTF